MKRKIVVVDDERAIRDMLSDAIGQAGYDVYPAPAGEDALSLIDREDIAIAICDIQMPGMNGIDLLQKITEISPETIVILITAYNSVETAANSLRYGAYDYMLKPLIFDDVLAKISRVDDYLNIKQENRILRQQIEGATRLLHHRGEKQTDEMSLVR